MWDLSKSRRFQALRSRELEGSLNEAEQAELAGLIRELEEEEAALLAPALQRLRQENASLEQEAERLENQRRALAELLAQKAAYLARAAALVVELELERVDLLTRSAEILGEPLRDTEATSASAG